MLLLPQTAAAAFKVLFLFCFGFPVLSFRSWSYSFYSALVWFCFVCHISGGGTAPLCIYLFIYIYVFLSSLSPSFFSLSLHCLLCLLRCNVVSLCGGFVTTELVSLLGGRIGADSACAGCRRVERALM